MVHESGSSLMLIRFNSRAENLSFFRCFRRWTLPLNLWLTLHTESICYISVSVSPSLPHPSVPFTPLFIEQPSSLYTLIPLPLLWYYDHRWPNNVKSSKKLPRGSPSLLDTSSHGDHQAGFIALSLPFLLKPLTYCNVTNIMLVMFSHPFNITFNLSLSSISFFLIFPGDKLLWILIDWVGLIHFSLTFYPLLALISTIGLQKF